MFKISNFFKCSNFFIQEFRMKLLASIYLLCGFAVGKAPHKKEDLEQMNEEQRHDFDKNIMLDTTDDVSIKSSAAQKDIKLPNILIRFQVTPD